jgi:hypothetical protein
MNKWLKVALPWLAFLAMLLWAWRTYPTDVPSYGDTLEVAWGARWYADALSRGISPLFYARVFSPMGWHTATLAHTPVFFVLALPFQFIGGAAFAYNCMAVLGLVLGFAGCLRLINLWADKFVATVIALVYAFAHYRWIRASGGHLNFLWATSMLPWFVWYVLRLRVEARPAHRRLLALFAGLAWAGSVYFSLYFVWIGMLPLLLLLCDRQRPVWYRVKYSVAIALIAAIAASPMLALFYAGSQADQLATGDVFSLLAWGTSANSLVIPPLNHPIAAVQSLARSIFRGDVNEINASNWGFLLTLLAAVGGIIGLRRSRNFYSPVLLVLWVSIVLALGVALQWNGKPVYSTLFASLNRALWYLGHILKPSLFQATSAPAEFTQIIPLPDFLLSAVVPFWESARVIARFSIMGGLMLCILAAVTLRHTPRVAKGVLAALLLIEMLPLPTESHPLPSHMHAAYAWLAKQQLQAGQSIIELDVSPIRMSGETLYTTLDDGVSTVSGAGSFMPKPIQGLNSVLGSSPRVLAMPDVAITLARFGVKYVVIHLKAGAGDTYEEKQWQAANANPYMKPIGCFPPDPRNQVWTYPICVAEVVVPAAPAFNVVREGGWSEFEPWGIWMLGRTSRVTWIPLKPDMHTLHLNAFPVCVPGQHQRVVVYVNDSQLAAHNWTACEAWDETLNIPQNLVRADTNVIRLEATYALNPGDGRVKNETRPLSIGVSELQVQ